MASASNRGHPQRELKVRRVGGNGWEGRGGGGGLEALAWSIRCCPARQVPQSFRWCALRSRSVAPYTAIARLRRGTCAYHSVHLSHVGRTSSVQHPGRPQSSAHTMRSHASRHVAVPHQDRALHQPMRMLHVLYCMLHVVYAVYCMPSILHVACCCCMCLLHAGCCML